MNGYRKAALMLVTLRDEDRVWMLERVTPRERSKLVPLVEEARALAVALDRTTLRELTEAQETVQRREEGSRIDSAKPTEMFAVLGSEPEWLLCALLRARPWKWRDGFLELLGTERRLRVRRALAHTAAAQPRVLQTLTDIIERRLSKEDAMAWSGAEPAIQPKRFRQTVTGVLRRGVARWRA
jgi:hypothetical protein